ncbi:MAG: DNA polymerase III subunit epsilon [Proteobacteria bacterium]|nr:DNA polymerase III subunit epsilon [Pseudomonadota bacterium]
MTREIVLDTETTGFEPSEGHKMVEIGCVELINHIPSGEIFHVYLNPERDVPEDAARIHGLTTEYLADKPVFTEKVGEFLDFIGKDKMIIHNAEFDMKFINAELKAAGFKPLPMSQAIDTLPMARKKYPGQPANLDALCRRFKVDNSDRTYHGALLDSELLAEVYLELIGGRQHGLGLASKSTEENSSSFNTKFKRQNREQRSFSPSKEELKAHKEFVEKINDALWNKEEAS